MGLSEEYKTDSIFENGSAIHHEENFQKSQIISIAEEKRPLTKVNIHS